MTKVRVGFSREAVPDVFRAVDQELAASGVRVRSGASVAIAVGSRGIAGLRDIVRATVAWVKAQGGRPFIVPAMGSHGGGTAEGQAAVLAGYGVTEAEVGAPVCSSMEVVALPQGEAPVPVYCDRLAYEGDATIVINRIKPHTSFHGPYESGLMKMLAIGLGKRQQAQALHRLGVAGLREGMPRVAHQVLRHGNVLLGVAVVENAQDEVMLVKAVPAARIPEEEPPLLELARANMPRLPADELDLLIVDEMGKDISGLGMDTNVIGRLKIPGEPEPIGPRIRMIIVRDLTAASCGNAAGMGLADIVTRRFHEKIDFAATYANVLTTGFLERGKLPLVAADDRAALETAFQAWGMPEPCQARIVRIRNTLRLAELLVSPTVLTDLVGRSDIEVVEPARPLLIGDREMAPW